MTSGPGVRSGEEIQGALRRFVERWQDYSGTERSEAQTFLGELFELTKEFGVGVKDFWVYWFRRAHQQLCVGQRAGLVGTNSVSQTSGRTASLDYIVDNGGVITDAVSTQKWPGEAKVHVSIVDWVKGSPPPGPCVLDGVEVDAISSQLRSTEDSSNDVLPLAINRHHAFAGVVPQAKGFVLTEA